MNEKAIYISKISSTGNEIWTELFDIGYDDEYRTDAPSAAAMNTDNGDIYVLSGDNLLAVDRYGSLIWNVKAQGSNIEFKDGYIYLGGQTITVFNTNGEVLNTFTSNENGGRIKVLDDGNVISVNNLEVTKYDILGDVIWTTVPTNNVRGSEFYIDNDGAIIVAQNATNDDVSIVTKYSDDGQQIWSKSFNFVFEVFNGVTTSLVAPTEDGHVLLAASGCTSTDCSRQLVKLDTGNGSTIESTDFSGKPSFAAEVLNDGRIALYGSGQLDVLDTLENIRYTFSSEYNLSSERSNGLQVTGNQVYIAYQGLSESPVDRSDNRTVVVAGFSL